MNRGITHFTAGLIASCGLFAFSAAQTARAATTYEVGPAKPYANIGDVPWGSLQAGDTVLIHWRSTPYKEKWVILTGGLKRFGVLAPHGRHVSNFLPVADFRNESYFRAVGASILTL